MINHLNSANQEVINLRTKNDRIKNDLRAKKETKERMMRSQENMNQLTELSQKKHKGKIGLGYTKQGESL